MGFETVLPNRAYYCTRQVLIPGTWLTRRIHAKSKKSAKSTKCEVLEVCEESAKYVVGGAISNGCFAYPGRSFP